MGMWRRVFYALALGLASSACASALGPGEYDLATDPAFAPDERAQIASALDAWAVWTEGRLTVHLTDDVGDATILRESTGTGRYSRRERALYVNPDELSTYDDGLRAMTANLVGQFSGMPLHDGCGVLGRECVRFELSEADRASCRSAGFCSP